MQWVLSEGYLVDDDQGRVDRDRLYGWLTSDAYWWSGGLDREVLDEAIRASLNLSCFDSSDHFVGFGRLVTDRATFAYWCDVYVDPEHRGRGLGSRLTALAISHPAIATCRRVMLATRDAHALYARAGFTPLAAPEIFMELHRPDAAAGPPDAR